MSIGPIPWQHIIAYAEWAELDYDLRGIFVLVMRAMDSTYLEWLNRKAKNG